MAYGIEVKNSSGEIVLDNERLMHRYWDTLDISSTGNFYYHTPLDHKPTVVDISLESFVYKWSHIVSNGQYEGIKTEKADPDVSHDPEAHSLFVIFARK